MSMKHYEQVIEFMNTFGQEVPDDWKMPTTKLANLRYNLIKEEIQELQDAINDDDIVEIADAMTDILYVVHGALAAFGMTHMLNSYEKEIPVLQKTHIPDVYTAAYFMRYLNQHLERMNESFISTDTAEVAKAQIYDSLTLLAIATYNFAHNCGIDIYKCFEEVHSSNMSKVCKTRIEGENSIQWRIETAQTSDVVQNYTGAYVDEINGFFVIKRKVDGKVLKGKAYFDPDLAKIVKL